MEVDCGDDPVDCSPSIVIPALNIDDCYWDGGWLPGTPQEIIDAECSGNDPSDGGLCEIYLDPINDVLWDNVCNGCIAADYAAATDVCATCCRAFSYYGPDYSAFTSVLEDLENCAGPVWWIDLGCGEAACTTSPTSEDCYYDTNASTTNFFVHPLSDVVFTVDSSSSYVQINYSVYSETFDVQGGFGLRTSTDQVLNGTILFQDGSIGGYNYTSWYFHTTVPVDYDPEAGWFSIYDPTAAMVGAGKRSTVQKEYEVHLGEEAFGQIHPANHTWELDYTQSGTGWSATAHFGGTYVEL